MAKQIKKAKKTAVKQAQIKDANARKTREFDGSGIDGALGWHRLHEKIKKQPDRTIFQGNDNSAAIIIDNNPTRASEGADFAGRVALIAGVRGRELIEGEEVDVVDHLFDDAGVYVVQRENPLEMFRTRIVDKKTGKLLGEHPPLADPNLAIVDKDKHEEYQKKSQLKINESHVTAYADRIQLVARNGGVNIYAGGVDSHLSTGIKNKHAAGVNLIGHNKVSFEKDESKDAGAYSLEPLVKGHKLEKALAGITKSITQMNGVQFEAQLEMTMMMWVLALHTHPAAFVYTFPSIELMIAILLGAPTRLKGMLSTVTSHVNAAVGEFNRSSLSTDSFKSRWNKTN